MTKGSKYQSLIVKSEDYFKEVRHLRSLLLLRDKEWGSCLLNQGWSANFSIKDCECFRLCRS